MKSVKHFYFIIIFKNNDAVNESEMKYRVYKEYGNLVKLKMSPKNNELPTYILNILLIYAAGVLVLKENDKSIWTYEI